MANEGCELFLVMPPVSSDGQVFFAKNSLRPSCEVQEVIYVPSSNHEPGFKLMHTYGEIEGCAQTHAVILSKPVWAWGAEMGANEHGVCIGCTSFQQTEDTAECAEKLLAIDLVRLGLERSFTSREALDIITSLMEKHGLAADNFEHVQAGVASESRFCTSFLICDPSDAWVLEVVSGKQWAAQQVTTGVRSILNRPTIRAKIDQASKDLKDYAIQQDWWSDDSQDFDFCTAYSSNSEKEAGEFGSTDSQLLLDLAGKGTVSSKDMLDLLRKTAVEEGSADPGKYVSVSSQLSVLLPKSSGMPCCHWFTSTPYPSRSIFKPFVFCHGAAIGDKTASRKSSESALAGKVMDGRPALHVAHREFVARLEKQDSKSQMALDQLRELESHCLQDVEEIMQNFDATASSRVSSIFNHITDLEMNFY